MHETFAAPAHWRAIDFLSDLHLAENTPRVFDAWAAHLRHTRAEAVFILGDLFEVWIGDDMAERGFEARCVEVLTEAAKERAIGFMPGNRDFLVGDAMLESSGVMRLADPTLVLAFDDRVLVSHGDALCLDDIGYQRYRAVVRRPGVQRAFAALPFAVRRSVGNAMRSRGGRRRARSEADFVDVDPRFYAARYLRESGDTSVAAGALIRETRENVHRLIGLLNRVGDNFDRGFHELFLPEEKPVAWERERQARMRRRRG